MPFIYKKYYLNIIYINKFYSLKFVRVKKRF